MKRIICLALLFLVFVSGVSYGKDFKEKEFLVTYKIQYNAMTLQDAAAKEKEIKKRYDKACRIEVEIEEKTEIVATQPNYIIEYEDTILFDIGTTTTELDMIPGY